MLISPSRKMQSFFVIVAGQKSLIMRHIFLKNAMEYAIYDIYAILCDEIAGTCKNCSLMKKRKNKDSPPNTLLFDYVHIV